MIVPTFTQVVLGQYEVRLHYYPPKINLDTSLGRSAQFSRPYVDEPIAADVAALSCVQD